MEPLEIAIKMELEGKAFYQKSSDKSVDPMGKELFARLAEEEDLHAETAREIHAALKRGASIEDIALEFDQGKRLNSIFAKATKNLDRAKQGAETEIAAIDTALGMEEKSRKFYEEQTDKTTNPSEKEFFRRLTAEEKGHYLALTDYKEYLTDPAGYFAKSEHISLDGG